MRAIVNLTTETAFQNQPRFRYVMSGQPFDVDFVSSRFTRPPHGAEVTREDRNFIILNKKSADPIASGSSSPYK